MIASAHYPQAINALHRALVISRNMALNKADQCDIADALDWIEILPTFIASPDDKTAQFREALAALAARFPDYATALVVFDRIPTTVA